MTWQDRWFHGKRRVREFFEDQWFDRTHHVRTSGDVPLRKAGIAAEAIRDSELYVPARPWQIREALEAANLPDPSGYCFVDLGSGKGRTLFVAAERPFRRILGVEFSAVLHERAMRNVRSFRFHGKDGRSIQSVHQDARDFVFPEEPMLLYMFNPFGATTMQIVLEHLRESLLRRPRHVVVVLLWPRCTDQVAQIDGMRLVAATQRHSILEAHRPQA